MKLSGVYRPEKHAMSLGLSMFQFPSGALDHLCNPVIQIDYFFMAKPFFKPHPHSGFSAVTYMLETSEGSFINRDSLGDISEIHPGDIHWTWSASGMMHEEVPKVPGTVCNGLQIFVNMPEKYRNEMGRAFHLRKSDVPVVRKVNAMVKVVVGSLENVTSPLALPQPFSLLDVKFDPSAELQLPILPRHGGLCLVSEGIVTVGGEAVGARQARAFRAEIPGEELSLSSRESSRVILLFGEFVKDPLYFSGSLAAGSEDALRLAMERFRRGEMGHLEASF